MNDEIELSEMRAMVFLPENAVEIELNCKVFDGDKIIPVYKKMDLSAIRAAFMDAENNYFEDDDTFKLTEKGKKLFCEN